jgi:O-antigen ligase
MNPKIENRAIQITKQSGYGIDQQGNVENSLGSRILIWDTAIRAFEAHPVFGIGVYSFRYSSYQYSQLPKFLYRKFVENLSVHQTHLAVLAETGLIGFLGFAVFIFTLLKLSFRAVRIARDEFGRRHALVAAVGVVYCTASMVVTDAWLWGQQIVLLGLVVGSMLAVRNIGNAEKAANA